MIQSSQDLEFTTKKRERVHFYDYRIECNGKTADSVALSVQLKRHVKLIEKKNGDD